MQNKDSNNINQSRRQSKIIFAVTMSKFFKTDTNKYSAKGIHT